MARRPLLLSGLLKSQGRPGRRRPLASPGAPAGVPGAHLLSPSWAAAWRCPPVRSPQQTLNGEMMRAESISGTAYRIPVPPPHYSAQPRAATPPPARGLSPPHGGAGGRSVRPAGRGQRVRGVGGKRHRSRDRGVEAMARTPATSPTGRSASSPSNVLVTEVGSLARREFLYLAALPLHTSLLSRLSTPLCSVVLVPCFFELLGRFWRRGLGSWDVFPKYLHSRRWLTRERAESRHISSPPPWASQ